ncbi:hypothetical protein C8R46DRAFT_1246095 [Mycena filopes]|nr:hypothetical protein C8R46DRAFT_1246095 [Mycena filopes]
MTIANSGPAQCPAAAPDLPIELFEYHTPSIRERLRYSLLPTETERAAIVESIAVAKHQRSELHVAAIRSGSTQDEEQQANLFAYISEYSSLLAPIRRLPHDILELIFLDPAIYLSLTLSWLRPARVVDIWNTHLVAAVSHHWRLVCLNTPRMWSRFDINPLRLRDSVLPRLRLCLERSQGATLTIKLDLTNGAAQKPAPSMDILNELMKSAERWGQISILLQNSLQIELFTPVRARLHSLHSLQISSEREIFGPPTRIFEGAPQLRTLRLGGAATLRSLSIPTHQIDRLSLVASYAEPCYDALSACPNVRDFSTLDCHTDPFAVATPHRCPELTKFTVDGAGTRRNMMGVFNRLTAPNLEALRIIGWMQWSTASAVVPFIRRSAAPLRELELTYTPIGAENLLALLHATPSLKALRLIGLPPDSITDSLIYRLTPASSAELLLPALEHFVLEGTHPFSTDAILRMLERRIASLNFVCLALRDRRVSAADRARFAALRVRPMFLRLRCQDDEGQWVEVE